MPAALREVTPSDLMPDAEFAKVRRERRAALMPIKRLRRIELGPVCTVHFESYETMLFQIQEMLRLIPDTRVELIERCSGHGGTFGVMKATHPVANKVGRPTARQIAAKGSDTLCSDCPLACKHLGQLLSAETSPDAKATPRQDHPIEVLARAYGAI